MSRKTKLKSCSLKQLAQLRDDQPAVRVKTWVLEKMWRFMPATPGATVRGRSKYLPHQGVWERFRRRQASPV